MKSFLNFSRILAITVMLCANLAAQPAAAASTPTRAQLREAQTIMTKFGIPTGPIDGVFGPQTARGLCGFRMIAGLSPARTNLSATLLKKLRQFDQSYNRLSDIPAPAIKGHTTHLVVQEKCQIMTYAENGRYLRALAVSTGKKGHGTPNGSFRLDNTSRGWHCSTLAPESCTRQSQGRFLHASREGNYGNMYNQRKVKGKGMNAIFVHGSTSVPTYPASLGCIRVTIADSDWMYDHVGNDEDPYMVIKGSY